LGLVVNFFSGVVGWVFVGGFRKIWLRHVVFWMVKRGVVVVICVAGSALLLAMKKVPCF